MLGGGVFLGVAVMDLLPNTLAGLQPFSDEHGVALGPILILIGYSLLLFVEKVLFQHSHAFHHHHHGHPRNDDAHTSSQSADKEHPHDRKKHSQTHESHSHGLNRKIGADGWQVPLSGEEFTPKDSATVNLDEHAPLVGVDEHHKVPK